MSNYDDLFKKTDDELFYPKPRNNKPNDPVDTVSELAQAQKRNKQLLLVYVVAMFLVSIVSTVFVSLKYGDIAAIVDNIEIVSTPEIIVAPSLDEELPFEYQMSGTLRNGNMISLPVIYVEYYFYDAGGKVIGTYYVKAEAVASGAEFSYSESSLFASEFVTTDYAYGFDESPFFYLSVNLMQMAVVGMLFLLIDKRAFRKDGKDVLQAPGKALLETAIGFVLVYVAMILAQLLMQYVLGADTASANEAVIAGMFVNKPLNLVMLFLLLCVFTPIVEEIIFRKVLCNFIEPRLGYLWAIAISGLIFGVMHVISYGDFVQAIPYVVMGWVFGYIYYRSKKNIFIPIGVHFVNNFLSYLLYLLPLLGYQLF